MKKTRKMTQRQRENLALAHLLDLDNCDPSNFRTYKINGSKWHGSEGAPEWMCNRDSDWWRWDGDYITIYDYSGGYCMPPEQARGKRRVASYVAGERDCPWCGPGTGNEDERKDCDLCEGEGLLYHEIGCYIYEVG